MINTYVVLHSNQSSLVYLFIPPHLFNFHRKAPPFFHNNQHILLPSNRSPLAVILVTESKPIEPETIMRPEAYRDYTERNQVSRFLRL